MIPKGETVPIAAGTFAGGSDIVVHAHAQRRGRRHDRDHARAGHGRLGTEAGAATPIGQRGRCWPASAPGTPACRRTMLAEISTRALRAGSGSVQRQPRSARACGPGGAAPAGGARPRTRAGPSGASSSSTRNGPCGSLAVAVVEAGRTRLATRPPRPGSGGRRERAGSNGCQLLAAAAPPVGGGQELVRASTGRARRTCRRVPAGCRPGTGAPARPASSHALLLGDADQVALVPAARRSGRRSGRRPCAGCRRPPTAPARCGASASRADAADQHVVAAGGLAGHRVAGCGRDRRPRGTPGAASSSSRASSAASGRSVSIQTASECERQTGTRTQVALMPIAVVAQDLVRLLDQLGLLGGLVARRTRRTAAAR